jgi:hypothetical protein
LRQRCPCDLKLIEELELGYAPGGNLRRHLTDLGYSLDVLLRTGLISNQGRDAFCRRVSFPFREHGHVINVRLAEPFSDLVDKLEAALLRPSSCGRQQQSSCHYTVHSPWASFRKTTHLGRQRFEVKTQVSRRFSLRFGSCFIGHIDGNSLLPLREKHENTAFRTRRHSPPPQARGYRTFTGYYV